MCTLRACVTCAPVRVCVSAYVSVCMCARACVYAKSACLERKKTYTLFTQLPPYERDGRNQSTPIPRQKIKDSYGTQIKETII